MELIYENHLKNAYFPADVGSTLAITDISCFQLSEETAWLIAQLPSNGTKETLISLLSELGITEPAKIFDKLTTIGVLREKRERSLREVIKTVIMPKFGLFSAQLQEKIFSQGFLARIASIRGMGTFIAGTLVGYFAWTAILLTGEGGLSGFSSVLPVSNMPVFILVVMGSLLHELGHSWAARISGIGFRPIGFSVYLVFPVLYTNVSGIEKVSFFRKILIDCGGFIYQGIYLLLLLPFAYIFDSNIFRAAAWWMLIISLFNLNPLFRTDGYWLYRDVYSKFKMFHWAKVAHLIYLAAFFVFSFYFLWIIAGRVELMFGEVARLVKYPEHFLHGVYRLGLGAYFVFLGLVGGVQRLREGHQEWKEFVGG